jgi:GMP synthase-like glutamine amidotransferase
MRILSVVHHRNAGAGVFCEPAAVAGHELVDWIPDEQSPPAPDEFDAAIVLGGAAHVDQEDLHPWLLAEKQVIAQLHEAGTPLLGVCLGSQLVAEAAGATVRPLRRPEIGWNQVALTPEGMQDPLLGFLPERFLGFGWHHYEWLLPPGGVTLASGALCLQAFRLEERPVWGVQFHPEVTMADLGSWLDNWESDPGAVATGLDPEAIRAESADMIGFWNDVGRGISERFLAVAAGELSPLGPPLRAGRTSAPPGCAPASDCGNRVA